MRIPVRNSQTIRGNNIFLNKIALDHNQEIANNKSVKGLVSLIMAGTYINTNISYPAVIRYNGSLPTAENARASLNSDGSVLFTWTNTSATGNANLHDKLLLITYFPELKKMVYMLHPSTRGKGSAQVVMTAMKGFVVDTWIGFVSHNEREAGDSVYAGKVIL